MKVRGRVLKFTKEGQHYPIYVLWMMSNYLAKPLRIKQGWQKINLSKSKLCFSKNMLANANDKLSEIVSFPWPEAIGQVIWGAI